jgi:hypothetical protein
MAGVNGFLLARFHSRVAAAVAKPASRPWWRVFRFSVRALIVLVIAGGVCLGLIVRRAHIQRDAVAAILKARGDVYYDWQWDGDKYFGLHGAPP